MFRKGLKGQVRKMKWIARRDWFLDEEHEYRLPNLCVGVVMTALITGTWLIFYAMPLSSLTSAAWATLASGLWLCVGFGLMLVFRNDL